MEHRITFQSDNPVIKDLCYGLINRCTDGGSSINHISYEFIIAELAEQRLEKCKLYGESRYDANDEEFDLWMCFSDVHRKYIRLRQLTKLASQGNEESIKSLVDAYRDIANYGIMGVQIIEKYHGKQTTDQD